MYSVPGKYYHRIHQVRPRFKNDLESVLLFIATELTKIDPKKEDEFIKDFDKALKLFKDNQTKKQKTIDNWRTEISSLFGFIVQLKNGNFVAGEIAKMLAVKQDLVEFFKYFLYTYQYPGGHVKPATTAETIEKGIKFTPAFYLLKVLTKAESHLNKRFPINKAEATHCIFNDLRVTRDHRNVLEVIDLMEKNRKNNVSYDWSGDVIRYAGDILDYMYYANLLVKHGGDYYLNKEEKTTTQYFLKNPTWFDGYDKYYGKKFDLAEIRKIANVWFHYVSSYSNKIRFETDVLQYVRVDVKSYDSLSKKYGAVLPELLQRLKENKVKTKDIGDTGEVLVHGHECMKLKNWGKGRLISRVHIYANHLKLGYDVRSFDDKELQKLIEVKTTVSSSSIQTNQFHLTDNELNAAMSFGENYFVYRLIINKQGVKLFVIQSPISKSEQGLLEIKLREGADVTFKSKAGVYEAMQFWKN